MSWRYFRFLPDGTISAGVDIDRVADPDVRTEQWRDQVRRNMASGYGWQLLIDEEDFMLAWGSTDFICWIKERE